MTDQYPITLAEFREWLLTKRATAIVGKRKNADSCPIAKYLVARGDEPTAVYGAFIGTVPAPAWVSQFVGYADRGLYGTGVQAGTALRLLDQVAHASLPAEDDWERTALESEALT